MKTKPKRKWAPWFPKSLRDHADRKPDEGRKFILMVFGSWGAGTTVAEAVLNLRRAGGKEYLTRHWVLLEVDEKSTIDQMGSTLTPRGKEGPKKIAEWKKADA